MIKYKNSIWEIFPYRTPIGFGHVCRHGLDDSPGFLQLNPEWQEGICPFTVAHEYHSAGIEVHDYGQVAMPLLDSNFINGQPTNILEIDFPETLLEISLYHLNKLGEERRQPEGAKRPTAGDEPREFTS